MAKTVRKTGVNGAMVRKLRRREGWSQGELAEKLAIHRVTLARWESNLVEPPPEAAEQLGKLFGVDPHSLYLAEGPEGEENAITDPWLQKTSLYKLQKYTRPALKALELTSHQIAHRVGLPVKRIQELLDGEKPTTQEIQKLRDTLGPDFNPTSILKKRIRLESVNPDNTSAKLDFLLRYFATLDSRMERLENTQKELLEKTTRVETFQLDLLQKLDKALKLLGERRRS